mmetsp:Transcript_42725/g.41052  ORF Transcript_42725/g.41052 Transcript_42725/m.41052 type:complete len:289 (+) Transcript_42725:55-921(+)
MPRGLTEAQLAGRMKSYVDFEERKEKIAEDEELSVVKNKTLLRKLTPYNKPVIAIITGVFFSFINGGVYPAFGVILCKCVFSFFQPNAEVLQEDGYRWSLYMLIVSLAGFVCVFIVRICFGVLGENSTVNVRKALYTEVLKKPVAWFDLPYNSPNVLNSVLSHDAGTLQGANPEGFAVILEALIGFLAGNVVAFWFTWEVSLLALTLFSLISYGGYWTISRTSGLSKRDDEAFKFADTLSHDSITSQKTVASFGNAEGVLAKYREYLAKPTGTALARGHYIGLIFGFS